MRFVVFYSHSYRNVPQEAFATRFQAVRLKERKHTCMKILIVDDHEMVREGLTRLIDKQEDMSIVGFAENGMEALYKIKVLLPDIVIMDTGMPVLRGLDAVPLIHRQAPEIKIILFSIMKNNAYIHQSFQEGASGFVHKLSPCKDILDSIHAAMQGEHFISPMIRKHFDEKYGENVFAYSSECSYDLLTNIEQMVFRLIVEGCTTRQIARYMSLSEHRLQSIKQSISNKIQLHDIGDMVTYAEKIGIITSRYGNDYNMGSFHNGLL